MFGMLLAALLIFGFILILFSKGKVTRKLNEYEAHLISEEGHRIGKAEWESFSNNRSKLFVKIYKPGEYEVVLKNSSIGRTIPYKNYHSLYLDSAQAQVVPIVSLDEEIVISENGNDIAKGIFKRDY